MKLVFVHGRSQEGKDPQKLQQQWREALDEGLVKAGLSMPPGVTLEFPFYGDRLDELIKELDAPLVEDVTARGAAPDTSEASFRGEFLQEMATALGISDEEIKAKYPGEVREKGPMNWEWIQAILKVLDRTALGEKAIDAFTRDVYVYLTNSTIRRVIDDVVAGCLPKGRCVVVGHSLGSVVGYNVLRDADDNVDVRRYITVGSPLGVESIKDKLDSPLAMPSVVNDWYNAMDERDVVALHPLDKDHFGITPRIENKTDVDNHTDNRHGIVGYLNDPDVARKIHEALISA